MASNNNYFNFYSAFQETQGRFTMGDKITKQTYNNNNHTDTQVEKQVAGYCILAGAEVLSWKLLE